MRFILVLVLSILPTLAVAQAGDGCDQWSVAGLRLGMTVSDLKEDFGKLKLTRNEHLRDGRGKAWYRLATKKERGKRHYVLPAGDGDAAAVSWIVTRWDYENDLRERTPVDLLKDAWGGAGIWPQDLLRLSHSEIARQETFVWNDQECGVRAIAVNVHAHRENPDPDAPGAAVGDPAGTSQTWLTERFTIVAITPLSDW